MSELEPNVDVQVTKIKVKPCRPQSPGDTGSTKRRPDSASSSEDKRPSANMKLARRENLKEFSFAGEHAFFPSWALDLPSSPTDAWSTYEEEQSLQSDSDRSHSPPLDDGTETKSPAGLTDEDREVQDKKRQKYERKEKEIRQKEEKERVKREEKERQRQEKVERDREKREEKELQRREKREREQQEREEKEKNKREKKRDKQLSKEIEEFEREKKERDRQWKEARKREKWEKKERELKKKEEKEREKRQEKERQQQERAEKARIKRENKEMQRREKKEREQQEKEAKKMQKRANEEKKSVGLVTRWRRWRVGGARVSVEQEVKRTTEKEWTPALHGWKEVKQMQKDSAVRCAA